jgi:hypothetical protein
MVDQRDAIDIEEKRLAITVDVWKYIVSVQMHFNDMEMRIRNLYFTILAASFGLLGVVQGKEIDITNKVRISIMLFVVLALIPISMLFYFMDRHWYHRLLQGAVAQGIEIESKFSDKLPEIQLGSQISRMSPVKFKHPIWKVIFFFVRDKSFRRESLLHSDQKIEVLYKSAIWVSVAVIVIYALIGGVRIEKCALLPYIIDKTCRA